MSKILLLGGAGFLGSHLTGTLLRKGEDLRIFARRNTCLDRLGSLQNQVEVIRGDFGDPAAVDRAVKGVTKVVHLISSTVPTTGEDSLSFDLDSNVLPTQKLLDSCLRHGVERFLFVSSGGTVYGEPEGIPIRESHPLLPVSEYGLGKMLIESLIHYSERKHGLSSTVLRLSNPYGPGQDPGGMQGVVSVALGRALDGAPFHLRAGGEAIRDYLYIDDAIEAISLTLKAETCPTVNISSGNGLSTREILKLVEEVSGKAINIVELPAMKCDVSVNILDPSLAAKHLDWKPRIDIAEGMLRTWSWLQETAGKPQ